MNGMRCACVARSGEIYPDIHSNSRPQRLKNRCNHADLKNLNEASYSAISPEREKHSLGVEKLLQFTRQCVTCGVVGHQCPGDLLRLGTPKHRCILL